MNIKIVLIFFVSLICNSTPADAQGYYFKYDNEAKLIYRDIIDLKLESARKGVETMLLKNPENLSRIHLENYIDFFEIFIDENEDRFKVLEKNKAKRLKLIEKNLNDGDPYKAFAIAEINLQWALARSKFNQLFRSGREVLSAYNLLKENSKRHPDFIYNKKSLSIIHSLIETITLPGIFKKVFGISGSIELGIKEISEVINHSEDDTFIFREEADAIYAFILFYQCNKQKEATEYIINSNLDYTKSLLSNFLIAKLLQRSGQNDEALLVLKKRPNGSEYSDFHYLKFIEGLSNLRKLNIHSADIIEEFLEQFEGKHYIKEAYQKLAWSKIVFEEDVAGYKYYMSLVENMGESLLDDDKQALKESKSNKIPDPILLKARLLYDGGYYEKAYTILTRNAHKFHETGIYTLEFNYRLARISQALKNYPDAIKYFSNTVNTGYETKSYYACNAALQLGLIYERLNEILIAEKYFKICLKLEPEDYKNSLHQKAKTGLERLEIKK